MNRSMISHGWDSILNLQKINEEILNKVIPPNYSWLKHQIFRCLFYDYPSKHSYKKPSKRKMLKQNSELPVEHFYYVCGPFIHNKCCTGPPRDVLMCYLKVPLQSVLNEFSSLNESIILYVTDTLYHWLTDLFIHNLRILRDFRQMLQYYRNRCNDFNDFISKHVSCKLRAGLS